VSKRCWEEKKNWGVTLAFASHLLLPTMSDREIGGELAIIQRFQTFSNLSSFYKTFSTVKIF